MSETSGYRVIEFHREFFIDKFTHEGWKRLLADGEVTSIPNFDVFHPKRLRFMSFDQALEYINEEYNGPIIHEVETRDLTLKVSS